ncbi:monoxygenase, putative [Talaromyces stipitatus ATCC 10500]|uniref:Monoxygenase, putative n=1 Tax=Talaromyces stipitatus (strain ATCC 10500 / CBS 375.48 / QM 6759 / NRRL 1006) TaxID=441959 RepID=B8M4D2_TALSN|nr:monooxygenase, putative [Talaromyces stipitatus ATCC 10500]EED19127.1 monoxygenase, putative [Talaromyces stipitatus ATCC 10500]
MLQDIIIIGSGISGLSAALAFSHYLTPLIPDLRITIFELHPVPSTSGGALSLSPVALRYFDLFGVLDELENFGADSGIDVDAVEIFSSRTGKALSHLDFSGKHGLGYGDPEDGKRYKARRVMRINLSLAMMAAAEKRGNIKIVFGKKFVSAVQLENEDRIEVHFQDESIATGNLLLGCDGVWSATRRHFIDPGRQAEYTGFSLVQGTVKTACLRAKPHFRNSSLNLSKAGSLLVTFYEKQRQEIFASAMVECREESAKDHTGLGKWKKEIINRSLRGEMSSRFSESVIPFIREIATSTEVDWMMYPIYQVPLGGNWYTHRAILLGDAAHAMLPRDESAAYAIDDTILLARILANNLDSPLETTFQIYDAARRSDISHAFRDSFKLWQKRNTDAGPIEAWFRERLIPFQIRNNQMSWKAAFEYDANKAPIPGGSRASTPINGSLRPNSKSRSSLYSQDTTTSSGGGSVNNNQLREFSSCSQPEITNMMNNLVVIEK